MSNMDVDPIEEVEMVQYNTQTEPSSSSRPLVPWAVVVDDAHPFDLDAYLTGYSGKPLCSHITPSLG
jgi:hypothetical protein